ncbi:hypothetical protein TWF718_006455 [Orbilia javanica]|uniref:NACHT domain-containing protein n=1 Tax=Orbilia javanica TaxID=47235 RepID=A0AAN8N0U4_9PEZI
MPSLRNEDYTIGWICALPLELAAARLMLDESHGKPQEQHHSDHNIYHLGSIGKHNIVIACLPAGVYGTVSAATVASQMLSTFGSIRFGLMVGIGGGVPSRGYDIRLGDIVISQPGKASGGVIQYGLGTTMGKDEFIQTGSLNKPPPVLLNAIANLQAEHEIEESRVSGILSATLEKRSKKVQADYSYQGASNDNLYLAGYEHHAAENDDACESCDPSQRKSRPSRDTDSPVIHYGIIASVNKVIKDSITRDLLGKEFGVVCFEMEAAGLMDNFPCLVIRGISDYADSHKNKRWQRYAAATAAAYAKELLDIIPAREVIPTKLVIEMIHTLNKVNEQVTDIKNTIKRNDDEININKLPFAGRATFDSDHGSSSSVCHPNTRIAVLEQIEAWFQDTGEQTILWLNGMAGTGKSTLARTIAKSFAGGGKLGASFFFNRSEGDRSHAKKFFTTLAVQLATGALESSLSPLISEAVKAEPRIFEKSLNEQFGRLIYGPLSELKRSVSTDLRFAIVIDALDECNDENDIRAIIQLLSQISDLEIAKILLTSRPELPIRFGFREIGEGKYKNLVLTEVPTHIIKQDIETFMEDGLKTIRQTRQKCFPGRPLSFDWPGYKAIQGLVDMATPLFIVAATICRILGDLKRDPERKLTAILTSRTTISGAEGIGGLYIAILNQLIAELPDADRSDTVREFREIVGAIVTLATPLSTKSLAILLGIDEIDIKYTLDPLHSVLEVPEDQKGLVRLLHLSFRDFLTDPENYGGKRHQFWIDEKERHTAIFIGCLHLLSGSLRQDICKIKRDGALRTEISRESIERCLPPDVQYACCYLVHHMELSGFSIHDGDQVHDFLLEHFLHWFEALSILEKSSDIIIQLRSLKTLVASSSTGVLEFIHDAQRFALMNRLVADAAPLQLYSSALIFAPENSIVRKRFVDQIPNWIHAPPITGTEWDAVLQVLDHHYNIGYWDNRPSPQFMRFSPDGRVIAAAGEGSKIQIYDTFTGAPVGTLSENWSHPQMVEDFEDFEDSEADEHRSLVSMIAFSPKGELLVSGSDDGTIRVWDPITGALKLKWKGHEDRVNAVSFSSDASLVLSVASDEFMQWGSASGALRGAFKGCFSKNSSITFSSGGEFFVSAEDDYQFWFWNPTLGLPRVPLPDIRIVDIKLMAYYQIREMVALSDYRDISIVSTATGELIDHFPGHEKWYHIYAMGFLSNGHLVALTDCYGGDPRGSPVLWDLNTERQLQVIPIRNGEWLSVAISPDGELLAFVSFASPDQISQQVIRIFESATGAEVRRFKQIDPGAGIIVAQALSLDSKLIASITEDIDLSVRIHDLETGELLHTLGTITEESDLEDNTSSLLEFEANPELWDISETWKEDLLFASKAFFLMFSHDGKRVAAKLRSWKTIKVWDSSTGLLAETVEGQWNKDAAFDFAPDGSLVIVGRDSVTFRVFRSDPEGPGQDLQPQWACIKVENNDWSGPKVVAISPNNNFIATANPGHNNLFVWDVWTQAPQWRSELDVSALVFSPDSKSLAATVVLGNVNDGFLHSVQLYDSATGEPLRTIARYPYSIFSRATMDFSLSKNLVAVRTRSGVITIFDSEAIARATQLPFPPGAKPEFERSRMSISPEGNLAVWADCSGAVELWEIPTGLCMQRFDFKWGDMSFKIDYYPVAFPGVCDAIIAYAQEKRGCHYIAVCNLKTRVEIGLFELGKAEKVHCLDFSINGRLLVAATTEGIRAWDVLGGVDLGKESELKPVAMVTEAPHNPAISMRPRLYFKLDQDLLTAQHQRYANAILSASISPDGTLIASGIGDSMIIKVWEVAGGELLSQWSWDGLQRFYPNSVNPPPLEVNFQFSPDGKMLVCRARGSLRTSMAVAAIWLVDSGKLLREIHWSGYWDGDLVYALSPNGKLLASSPRLAGKLPQITLHDVVTGEAKQVIPCPYGVETLSFSEGGRQLKTNKGVFNIEHLHALAPPESTFHNLTVNGEWVFRNGERILWIPHTYRRGFTIHENTIIFITKSESAPPAFLRFTA